MPNLETVTLPAGLTGIPKDAFAGSTKLATVKFGADTSNGGGSSPSGRDVTGEDNTITLPTRITTIDTNAFAGTAATTVDLSLSKLSQISDNTFTNMTKLAEVKLPASITQINNNAFQGDAALVKLSQESPTTGGSNVQARDGEGTATFGSKLISIGNNAFQGTGFTTVDLSKAVGTLASGGASPTPTPATTLSVGSNAFTNMVNLTTVTLPGNATNINPANFGNPADATKQNLTSITYGDKTTATATATLSDATISSPNFSKIKNSTIEIKSSVGSSGINFNGGVFNGNTDLTTLKLNVTQSPANGNNPL